MFKNTISLEPCLNFPQISHKCDLGNLIIESCRNEFLALNDRDILCIASKIVSKSQGLLVDLNKIVPSELALEIHRKIPRKDPRIIQLIIDQTSDSSGSRLQISHNFIGAWLSNGLFLTNAGVDQIDENTAIVLPQNCDEIAKEIARSIYEKLGFKVAIVITDG